MIRRDAVLALSALLTAAGVPASFAQAPGRVWRLGFLTLGPIAPDYPNNRAFLEAMRERGYVEGRNLVIEWRSADGNFERLPGLAAEIVQLKVDLIVAVASAAIGAAQKATTTIPIVMATTGDPVGSGFVKSLARPGGNITGMSNLGGETGAKHVELLLAVVPKVSRLAVLVTPTSTTAHIIAESVRGGARKAGVTTLVVEASTPQEMENAFALMTREKVDALVVGAAPYFALHRREIVDLANKTRIPAMFGNRLYVEAGGLMSYGYLGTEAYRRTAAFVDRILKGAKPGDLPVEQPVVLELVVNLKTAKALGLAIPQSILMRAETI